MMNKILLVAGAAVLMAAPGAAQAAGYGMAGCGLGSIAMGADGNQVLAATTNGTSYSQFFGITSGTSNCSDSGGAASASLDQKLYLRTNYANVMRDAAVGQGEYLATFATLLGCEATAQPTLFKLTQDKHGELFVEDAGPAQVLTNIKTEASRNAELRGSCARI